MVFVQDELLVVLWSGSCRLLALTDATEDAGSTMCFCEKARKPTRGDKTRLLMKAEKMLVENVVTEDIS